MIFFKLEHKNQTLNFEKGLQIDIFQKDTRYHLECKEHNIIIKAKTFEEVLEKFKIQLFKILS
jgi:hypothetical protein